jgi:hypothetical protein
MKLRHATVLLLRFSLSSTRVNKCQQGLSLLSFVAVRKSKVVTNNRQQRYRHSYEHESDRCTTFLLTKPGDLNEESGCLSWRTTQGTFMHSRLACHIASILLHHYCLDHAVHDVTARIPQKRVHIVYTWTYYIGVLLYNIRFILTPIVCNANAEEKL